MVRMHVFYHSPINIITFFEDFFGSYHKDLKFANDTIEVVLACDDVKVDLGWIRRLLLQFDLLIPTVDLILRVVVVDADCHKVVCQLIVLLFVGNLLLKLLLLLPLNLFQLFLLFYLVH